MIPLSAEVHANYYTSKYIVVDLGPTQVGAVKINHMHLTLSEAYKLWDQLGLALKEAEYPSP